MAFRRSLTIAVTAPSSNGNVHISAVARTRSDATPHACANQLSETVAFLSRTRFFVISPSRRNVLHDHIGTWLFKKVWRHRDRLSGVHSRTSKTAQSRYTCSMQPKYMKAAISAVWVCALCAVALFGHFTFSAWALLVAFAVLPPLVVMRFWRDPIQTTSQSIQEVLR